eukprot:TRINITY_DN35652_c0_g1_i1.p1 TRINITY_DN35652_c0_g1~~TRINITY_DN35652_c0_g1_i1.p1  ORF type:complete len:589 (+),score=71.34 TRINITY_DN35652_c0_g1_i1:52-1818(+)
MTIMLTWFVRLGACVMELAHSRRLDAVDVVRLRDRSAGVTRILAGSNTGSEVRCADLHDVEIGGHSLGLPLQVLCSSWPEAAGAFPVKTVEDASEILNSVFEQGGVYDQFKQLLVQAREGELSFCWKEETLRRIVKPSSLECPLVFNKHWAHETSTRVLPVPSINGTWCSKNCSEICHGMFMASKRDENHMCYCKSRNPQLIGLTRYQHVHTMQTGRVPAAPRGCNLVQDGVCYGECPDGFESAWNVGSFALTCQTHCTETERPISCGMGCARTAGDCGNAVFRQVMSVLRIIGSTAGFVLASPQVVLLTDAIIDIAELTMTVLGNGIQMLRSVARMSWRETKFELLMALVEAAINTSSEQLAHITDVASNLREALANGLGLLSDMLDLLGGTYTLDAKGIAKVFLKHPDMAIRAVYDLVKGFAKPKCGLLNSSQADSSPELSTTEAGTSNLPQSVMTTTTGLSTTATTSAPPSDDIAMLAGTTGCPSAVLAEWSQLGLVLDRRPKQNGRIYARCRSNNPSASYKLSCKFKECDAGDSWCIVNKHCGNSFRRCSKIQAASSIKCLANDFDVLLRVRSRDLKLRTEAWK